MVQVRVGNVTRVALSPTSGATSCPEEPIRLSFLDTVWIPLPPVQRLFLYSTVDRPLAAVAQDLRASLARVLPRFRSLAGTLTHVPDSGDVVISFCGDGRDGVDVLEAEADEGADFRRLAEDEDHDLEAFSSLVPPLDVRELPAPVFAVQVTGFGGGGVAVGLSLLHVVADGKALWLFVEAWAAECRRAVLGGSCGGAAVAPVVLDRSVIKCPDDEDLARFYTRTAAPDLPKLDTSFWFPDGHRLQRRTFVVNASSIAALRDRGTSGGATKPSAFVALAAHAWITFLRAKSVPLDEQTSILSLLADCRRHLDPPVGDEYFGNCVRPCLVQAKTSELLRDDMSGFTTACAVTREAINDYLREPLGDRHGWYETWRGLPQERMTNMVASPRFRVYETDFGWGQPRRVELVSMNKDGEVAMVAARDEEGAIQATVAMLPLYMDNFTSLFLGGLKQVVDVKGLVLE